MAKYNFLFNVDQCVFCHACEIACMQENELPSHPWTRVVQKGPRSDGANFFMDFLQQRCVQCEDPLCMKVCPVEGAIVKNEDGIVVLNHRRCILCQSCVSVCPYGALELSPDKRLIGKCHFCLDRLEEGRKPSCVHTCMGKALEILTEEQYQARIAGAKVKRAGLVTYLFNTLSRESEVK
jgi:Fe-S-cluster-containing dehydrogenase component